MSAESLEKPRAAEAPPPGPFKEVWLAFAENKGAVAGLVVILIVAFVAIFADVLALHSPIEQYRDALLAPPVWQDGGRWSHPLGTDDIGRDILSRLIYGARLSMVIGTIVVTISLAVGTMLGLAAAFLRGVTDIAIMRLMDVMLALPSLLLAIVIVAILGPGLFNAMIAVSIVTLPHFTRLARAAAMSELTREYVASARLAGSGPFRLMFVTVLPNCLAPLIVQATLGFSNAILDAAALGFLGLGAQPPTPEWGTMLAGSCSSFNAPGGWSACRASPSWSPCSPST